MMTRWVLGAVVGALAIAPVGFAGVGDDTIATVARLVSLLFTAAAIVLTGLAVVWNRKWAI